MNKRKKVHTLEDQLYRVGLVLLILVVVSVIVLKKILPPGLKLTTCPLYAMTGYYCLGCGGTRAFIKLLEGDVIGSFIYHPVVLYVTIIFFIFMISHTIEKMLRYHYSRKSISDKRPFIRGLKFRPWYLYGVLVVAVVNMIIKNVMIYAGIWHN